MLPEITVFGLTIKFYSLFAAMAALTGAAMAFKSLRRAGLSAAKILILYALVIVSFLIGARLWNVAVNPSRYDELHPWYLLRMTGLSLYGGIAGAALAAIVFVRAVRAPLLQVLDAGTVPFGAAFCIQRVGCFLNGCCYGTYTDLPWGVAFPGAKMDLMAAIMHKVSYTVHPTQIYELILALAGIPLCLLLVKKLKSPAGSKFALYAAWFSLARLAVLPLRVLPYSDVIRNVAYPALYIAVAAGGIVGFIILKRKARKREGEAFADGKSGGSGE